MEPGGIFLIQDGSLAILSETAYDSEDLLQKALAEHPEVLAGGTTQGDRTTPLLLIRREMGIPAAEGASSTWSLDHLFVDPEGVPVVVEVKRSSDKRIRREVVGQMLDYAANAVRYWPVSGLRDALDSTIKETPWAEEDVPQDADQAVVQFSGLQPEEFWGAVEGNLAQGRIRMVFVADHLPPELVRVIEFLNEQMSPAEVLGVEVPQFVGGQGVQVLVPRLVGATTTAAAAKSAATGPYWTEESFLEVAKQRRSGPEVELMKQVLHHAEEKGSRLSWGRSQNPGVAGWYQIGSAARPVWAMNTGGSGPASRAYLQFQLPELAQVLPGPRFEQFVTGLEAVPSLKPRIEAAREVGFQGKYPSAFLSEVVHEGSGGALMKALEFLASE